MWERAFPLAAYWCRKCGNRFRATRAIEELECTETWLIRPERVTGTEGAIDQAVSLLLERVTNGAPPPLTSNAATEQRIDEVLRSVAGLDLVLNT